MMEDGAVAINDFVNEADAAARLLAARFNLPILCSDVEAALVEVLALSRSFDLLGRGLTKDKILSALGAFDFRRFFPELLAEFEVEGSIIPPGGIRLLLEQTVRARGE